MQGLSSPGWQSVRAGEDPALFAWLPLFLKYRRFARPDSGKPQNNYTDKEENLFIALWIVTGEKGQGLPPVTSTQHQPPGPGKVFEQGSER